MKQAIRNLWYDWWVIFSWEQRFELLYAVSLVVIFYGAFIWLAFNIGAISTVPLGQLTLRQLTPYLLAIWLMYVCHRSANAKK